MRDFAAKISMVLDRVGVPGVIAIGIMVFAVIFCVGSLAPARARLHEVRMQLDDLHAKKIEGNRHSLSQARSPVTKVKGYYKTFPGSENLTPALGHALEIAKKHTLAIEQANYHYESKFNEDLSSYQMSFTLKGPYPKIRDFLVEMLKQQPGMAIDELNFRRDGAGSFGVEAKVQLTFFVRRAPWTLPNVDAG